VLQIITLHDILFLPSQAEASSLLILFLAKADIS
jgi:hypothetical protein